MLVRYRNGKGRWARGMNDSPQSLIEEEEDEAARTVPTPLPNHIVVQRIHHEIAICAADGAITARDGPLLDGGAEFHAELHGAAVAAAGVGRGLGFGGAQRRGRGSAGHGCQGTVWDPGILVSLRVVGLGGGKSSRGPSPRIAGHCVADFVFPRMTEQGKRGR